MGEESVAAETEGIYDVNVVNTEETATISEVQESAEIQSAEEQVEDTAEIQPEKSATVDIDINSEEAVDEIK